ncbi:hypothetical protein DKT74_25730 [Streptomyces sp. ZEA17I]|nr:hypothetical protein DKT74_25730 [Streptomyces sp. ZEA17I]
MGGDRPMTDPAATGSRPAARPRHRLHGDVGSMGAAGRLHVVDREKGMINASGFEVRPREVEILAALPKTTSGKILRRELRSSR